MKEDVHSRGVRVVNSWREDWCRFVRDVFGVRLDGEQEEILHSVQTNPRTSVSSGTARGKDFVSACASLCFLYLTPRWNKEGELICNTKVALTAPTDRQVKNIMMPEISRLWGRAKNRGVILPGKLNAYDIRTESKEWFLTGFKADDNNHEAWSGFHAVNTMFVVTEASGVSDNTFSAIEGNLQGNSRILIVFNPNSSVGYAAKSQKSERWARFRLSSLTAPNVKEKRLVIPGQVDYAWVEDKVRQWSSPIERGEVREEMDDFEFEGRWYRPEDLFRVKVLGRFPKVSEDTLIPMQWVEMAHERWKKFQEGSNSKVLLDADYRESEHIMGVDVAGMGRDATVYCERWGGYVFPFRAQNSGGNAEHMRVAGEIYESRGRDRNLFVSIDTIGEGAGVYSRCMEMDRDGAEEGKLISCKYSEGAKRGERDLTDRTGERKFVNMRAYLFWSVRDWLDPKNGCEAMLPPDSYFDEEAGEIKWFLRSDGKILIEPKEEIKRRIGRSTDRFDALANTFYPIKRGDRGMDMRKLYEMIY